MEVVYFTHNRGTARKPISSHKIAYYDLTLLLSGEMCWYVDGEAQRIRGGDVLLIEKGATLRREAVENCDYFSFNFYSDEELNLPRFLPGVLGGEVRMLLSVCEEIWHSTRDFDILSHLLGSLLVILKRKISENEASRLVLDIKRYVAEHIGEQITLGDVAVSTFFSTVYCSAVFKRETGQSIIDYVIDEKMKTAKLLIMDNMALSDVSDYLGYSDYNYFSRIFKKKSGMSPIEYKKICFP